ncbi:Cyclin-Q [Nymphon striatum]|nr:Cyclin-Q [Nymphon striatum]
MHQYSDEQYPSEQIKRLLELGAKLKAKAVTIATAACLFHDFIEKASDPQNYDLILVTATCMYLAGKIEEDHHRVRDIINVVHNMLDPSSAPLELGEHYWNLRDSVVQCELLILRLLKFRVSYNHPHKYLLHYWNSLSNWLHNEDVDKIPILRTCWALLSDFYLYPTCLQHKPQHVAIAVLELSLQCYGVEVPCNDDALLQWQEALYESATKDVIQKITLFMMKSY